MHRHWLNGSRVLAYDLDDPGFRARVRQSKFRQFTGFASATRGRVGLQHHGGEAWFRNIRMDVPPLQRPRR